jgi:hypothetical protein
VSRRGWTIPGIEARTTGVVQHNNMRDNVLIDHMLDRDRSLILLGDRRLIEAARPSSFLFHQQPCETLRHFLGRHPQHAIDFFACC